MQHQIETNTKREDEIATLIHDVRNDHGLTMIKNAFSFKMVNGKTFAKDHIVITARCNGAALRDLVAGLDRLGYLD